jgi:hypothetical protein
MIKRLAILVLGLCFASRLFGQAGGLVNGSRGFPVPNSATTGTTLYGTATITSAGQAINATTSNTTVPVYIVTGGAGTSGNAALALPGTMALCTMDSNTTGAGSYFVVQSTTNTAYCHAQAATPSAGVWVIGYLLSSSTTSVATSLVLVNSFIFGGGSGGGGSGTVSSGGYQAIPEYSTNPTGTTVGPSSCSIISGAISCPGNLAMGPTTFGSLPSPPSSGFSEITWDALGNANESVNGGAFTPLLYGGASSNFAANVNANFISDPLEVSDTSGSGTAQTGSSTPPFAPAADTCFIYTTTTTNSGTGLTTNINLLGAKSVAIPGSSGWTTTLTAGIIPANKPLWMCYDGTNMNVQQTGTAAAGASGVQYSIQTNAGGGSLGNIAPPALPGIYYPDWAPTGAAAVAPTSIQVGQSGRSLSGSTSTDTIAYTDVNSIIDHDIAASAAITETIPVPTTAVSGGGLGNSTFAFTYCNHSTFTDVLSPTTWTIQNSTFPAGGSLSVASGACFRVKIDPHNSTNWLADAFGAGSVGGNLQVPSAVSTLNAFGDSITACTQIPSGQQSQCWPSLVTTGWALPLGNNFAVQGARLNNTGFVPSAYAISPSGSVGSIMLLGTNDLTDASSSGNRTQIGWAEAAMLTWLALPNANRELASSMAQTGTWSTVTDFGLTSVYSNTASSTLTGTVSGTTIYVGGAWGSGLNFNFDVSVDGTSVSGGAGFTTTWGLTASGHYPWSMRFSGYTNTSHTVVITRLATGSGYADIQWIAGNGSPASTPFVAAGSSIQHTGITNSNVTALNLILSGIVSNLATDGLKVVYVEDYNALSLTAIPPQYNADGTHPNNLGNIALAGAWFAALGETALSLNTQLALLTGLLNNSLSVPNSGVFPGTNNWNTPAGNVTGGGTVLEQYVAQANGALSPASWQGILYQRLRPAGCATAASIGATCDTTVTWGTAFQSTSYTAVCTGDAVTSGVPLLQGENVSVAKAVGSITVRTYALTAAAAQFTNIDCIAWGDGD